MTVSFDQSVIPKPETMEPKPFVKPTEPVNLPENAIGPDPKDPKYLADQKAAEEKAAREKTDYEKKIEHYQAHQRSAGQMRKAA